MTAKPITLECHRYGVGPQLSRVNMEDSLQAVSVTKDITGKEDIQLSMIGPFEDPQTTFVPGDFAVIRDQIGMTWSWGRVSMVRSQLKREIGGQLTHSPYAVMVQGWYDFLSRSKVHTLSVSARESVGTMFNLLDWTRITEGFYGMYGQPAGAMLQYMIKNILRIRLPESLGGGWFADEIPVVHDKATAQLYAPEFEDIEPVDFGDLMPQLTTGFLNTRSSDVGALIANMFLFENSIVELIPYLSIGGNVQQTTPTPLLQNPTNANSPLQNPPPNPPVMMNAAGGMTKLGTILGVQPVLVYRIKPFRARPLYSAAVSKIHYKPEEVEKGYLDKQLALYDEKTKRALLDARADSRNATTELLFDNRLFADITFTPSSITSLPYDYITSISRQRSDTERVNATTINAVPSASGGTTITDVDYLALPVAIDNQIEEHGLRLRIAKWNLYPETYNASQGGSMTGTPVEVYYRAVAAQVMQFYKNAHLYETGTINMYFAHTLYAVESQTRQMSTYDKAVLDLEPGRWFRTSFQGMDDVTAAPADEYFGYITGVSHNVQRLPTGALTANTQVQFQRGHFAEMWDLLNDVTVPLGEIDRPPSQSQQQAARRACGNAKEASDIDYLGCAAYQGAKPNTDAFNAGAPESAARYDPSNSKFPYAFPSNVAKRTWEQVPTLTGSSSLFPWWLRCWMLEAVSVMPSPQALAVRSQLDAGFKLRSLPNDDAKDAAASVYMLAACGYIIERYWRSRPGYEGARFRIRSIYRKDQGFHGIWAAMDFYIELPPDAPVTTPGALQVWAALSKLAAAGRIPQGGRGVYLNVNPTTGILGTAPDDAGSSSGTGCGLPPGGSSYTHYDIRGAYNITRKGLKTPTTWVGTDWNGDGSDEISIGAEFTAASTVNEEDPGITDRPDQVFANIADPGFTKLDKYLKPDLAERCPALVAVIQQRKTTDPNSTIENTRVAVRDEIRRYYNSYGLDDPWLHEVSSSVPNITQVMNDVFNPAIAPPTPAPTTTPAESESEGDLYLVKDADDDPIEAALVMTFGGINVNGQEARVYMKPYMQPLFAGNHVFIAANDRVDFDDCYDFAVDTDYNPRPPQKRVLYVFSNGAIPALTYIRASAGTYQFDKIYLVDAFLKGSTAAAYIADMKTRPGSYVFFYTSVFNNTGNGMAPETLNAINAIANLERVHVADVPGSDMTKHLAANDAAMAHLRNSGLVK
jgi:hypothetical protein